jgi:hypothetical protein
MSPDDEYSAVIDRAVTTPCAQCSLSPTPPPKPHADCAR